VKRFKSGKVEKFWSQLTTKLFHFSTFPLLNLLTDAHAADHLSACSAVRKIGDSICFPEGSETLPDDSCSGNCANSSVPAAFADLDLDLRFIRVCCRQTIVGFGVG
jgi:hypothetical protein